MRKELHRPGPEDILRQPPRPKARKIAAISTGHGKAALPIYNIYVLFKRVWRTGYFWMMVLGALVVGVATALGTAGTAVSAMTALASVAQLLVLILNIMFNVKLARSFGKGVGFAIGLIFLNPIFMLILGFGSAKYVGADR